MKSKKSRLMLRALLTIVVVLLTADVLLGIFLARRSKAFMREVLDARMLDIANTAAAMVDGDALKNLAAGDENTPAYRKMYETLQMLERNTGMDYTYAVRSMGSNTFIFVVDPAEDGNAAQFGELVTVTDALKTASLGTSAVSDAYEDTYGRFYTAYSPVRDSAGRIVGAVAVDFRADSYDAQISNYTNSALLLSILPLLIGAVGIALTLLRQRRMEYAMAGLSDELEALTKEIVPAPAAMPDDEEEKKRQAYEDAVEEAEAMREDVRLLRKALRRPEDEEK